jgi:hypothetical protein
MSPPHIEVFPATSVFPVLPFLDFQALFLFPSKAAFLKEETLPRRLKYNNSMAIYPQ